MHHVYRGDHMDEDQISIAKKFLEKRLNVDENVELSRFFENRNFADKLAGNCKSPHAYWNLREYTYPNSSELGRRLMLMPASTALLEGLFSQWSYVHSKYRNRLSYNKTGTLIDLYLLSKHLDIGVWTDTVEKKKKKHVDIDEDCC